MGDINFKFCFLLTFFLAGSCERKEKIIFHGKSNIGTKIYLEFAERDFAPPHYENIIVHYDGMNKDADSIIIMFEREFLNIANQEWCEGDLKIRTTNAILVSKKNRNLDLIVLNKSTGTRAKYELIRKISHFNKYFSGH